MSDFIQIRSAILQLFIIIIIIINCNWVVTRGSGYLTRIQNMKLVQNINILWIQANGGTEKLVFAP
jgi:hypothetical protein